jgi:uncharacterized protein (TIGR00730 family)
MSASARAIAVFCGARKGNDPAFVALANQVGRALAERGWLLVYGGSAVGLMGELADAALAAGGQVLGVIPQQLVKQEVGHTGLQRLEVVADMPVRKTRMIDVADGFLVLPGGFGTLDELFEVVTLRQIGLHAKPIVLCDPFNYWGRLLEACRGLVEAGLANPRDLDSIEQFSSVQQALDRLGEEPLAVDPALDPALDPAQSRLRLDRS